MLVDLGPLSNLGAFVLCSNKPIGTTASMLIPAFRQTIIKSVKDCEDEDFLRAIHWLLQPHHDPSFRKILIDVILADKECWQDSGDPDFYFERQETAVGVLTKWSLEVNLELNEVEEDYD